MVEGIENDSVSVPGLGEMNSPDAFSVFTVSLANPEKPEVIAKTKTGNLVGDIVEDFPAVGGSSPNSLVATTDYVFVTKNEIRHYMKESIFVKVDDSELPDDFDWKNI